MFQKAILEIKSIRKSQELAAEPIKWVFAYLAIFRRLTSKIHFSFTVSALVLSYFFVLFCFLPSINIKATNFTKSVFCLVSLIHWTIQKTWVSTELTSRHAIVTLQCYFHPVHSRSAANYKERFRKWGWTSSCSIQNNGFTLACSCFCSKVISLLGSFFAVI